VDDGEGKPDVTNKATERVSRTALRKKAAVLAVTAGLLGGLALSGTPASASASQGVIAGTDIPWDDWGDEGPISATDYATSNVTAMWQQILWADGLLSWSDIDCRFGPITTAATKNWQTKYQVPGGADGIVGQNTLNRAALHLSGAAGTNNRIIYNGRYDNRRITMTRQDDGRWGMWISSDLRPLWYNNATFTVCP
jgi:peptidoglycan hydrolase-like protein with peptidoglycan-binding domain